MVFSHKAKKTSKPRKPRQQRGPSERHKWIYIGIRKRQDFLSKAGVGGSEESVVGKKGKGMRIREKYIPQ